MLFIENLDYLIYSSHKTATQSLNTIFNINGFKSRHCHYIQHLTRNADIKIETYAELKQKFIEDLDSYKKHYNKKINVISIIRNPVDRLPSSFFQTYHTDEISFYKREENETTIMQKSIEELIDFFINKIKNKRLRGGVESLDEISHVFQTDIILNLENKDLYYYFENKFINLFVLDFNKIASADSIKYINQCLGINLTKYAASNLSNEKIYYEKYKKFKSNIIDIKTIIENQYNSFYFGAFL